MDKKISVLHPSYKRPQLAKVCYNTWIANTKDISNIEYILSLADNDPTLREYQSIFEGSLAKIITMESNGWVKQLNHAAHKSVGKLLVCIGDDFSCPLNWDESLLNMLEGEKDFVVKTQDGQQPWIMTLPLMDREYYNRFGYIVYPGYMHMFGDTELTHVADLLGKTINLPLVFPHNHYTTGRMQKDSVNVQNDLTWNQGELLYISRMKSNFNLDDTLTPNLPGHHIEWLKTRGVTV